MTDFPLKSKADSGRKKHLVQKMVTLDRVSSFVAVQLWQNNELAEAYGPRTKQETGLLTFFWISDESFCQNRNIQFATLIVGAPSAVITIE